MYKFRWIINCFNFNSKFQVFIEKIEFKVKLYRGSKGQKRREVIRRRKKLTFIET